MIYHIQMWWNFHHSHELKNHSFFLNLHTFCGFGDEKE